MYVIRTLEYRKYIKLFKYNGYLKIKSKNYFTGKPDLERQAKDKNLYITRNIPKLGVYHWKKMNLKMLSPFYQFLKKLATLLLSSLLWGLLLWDWAIF